MPSFLLWFNKMHPAEGFMDFIPAP